MIWVFSISSNETDWGLCCKKLAAEFHEEFPWKSALCLCRLLLDLLVFGLLLYHLLQLFMVASAKSLQTLGLPRSEISDSIVENLAWKLSTITFLDVSYCKKMGAPALEAIGKHCKFLTGLRRIMHPPEIVDKPSQDDEALAIASTMPKLKRLEMSYLLISTEAVLKILASCCELELLDVRGCWKVKLDEKLIKTFSGLKVVIDCHEGNGWDDCSSFSGPSGYLAWDFMGDEMEYYDDELFGAWEDESMDDLELRFYDGFDSDNAGFDWPQSP